jgi:hypothetical protein
MKVGPPLVALVAMMIPPPRVKPDQQHRTSTPTAKPRTTILHMFCHSMLIIIVSLIDR